MKRSRNIRNVLKLSAPFAKNMLRSSEIRSDSEKYASFTRNMRRQRKICFVHELFEVILAGLTLRSCPQILFLCNLHIRLKRPYG